MGTGRTVSGKAHESKTTLPIIGHIAIGGKTKSTNGKEIPTSLDYFRARGKGGEPCKYEKQFTDAFGDKPTKIPIAFISDDIEEVCNQQFECWKGGKFWGKGDGVNFHVYDPSRKEYVNVTKESPLVTSLATDWKERLTMTFVIPAISGVLGVWKFTTSGSKSTIPEIVKTFDFIKEKMGTIRLVPFELMVENNTGRNPGETRQWKSVKLIPAFTEDNINAIRGLLTSGGSLEQLGIFTLNSDRIKEISAQAPEVKMIEGSSQHPE